MFLIGALFFFSGAAALVYQVVWMRHAGLHLGSTTTAVGTVVATFLGGLALGSAAAGRWVDRAVFARSEAFALRVYGILEIGIGAYAFAFAPLLSALTSLLMPLYGADGEGPLFLTLRLLVCAVCILPPTMAMGASLPVLARFTAARGGDGARATGLLYSINTLGGVLGAAAAGWVLLPYLGLFVATSIAAALNIAVGLTAVGLARGDRSLPSSSVPAYEGPRWIFPAYALSGFAALACEIAWTRGLVLSLGCSVYAFSLTLAAFILGLGMGGVAGTGLAARVKDPVLLFGGLQVGVLLLAAATVVALEQLPVLMMKSIASAKEFSTVLAVQALLAAAVVLLPASLLGAMFPALCRLAVGKKESAGAAVGKLYSWNTTGNILGALGASFFLLPWLGIPGTILTAAVIHGSIAAWAFLRASTRRLWLAALAVLGTILVPIVVPGWDLALVSATPVLYAKGYTGSPGEIRQKLRRASKIIYQRWDGTGLVTVHKAGKEQFIRVNGKTDASNLGDMRTQTLCAHVPLLLHPDPKEVLVIGVGSGATAAAALRHRVNAVDAIDLSPAVVEASRYFEESLGPWRSDARVKVFVADARTYSRGASRRYDVISAQPSNLWISGMATLFTREHFERYRALLRPGGIVCQWVQGYLLPVEDFASIVATFRSIFPRCTLWEVGLGTDYLLIGAEGEFADARTVEGRFSKIAREMSAWEIPSVDAFLRNWIGGPELARALGASGCELTDDFCPVEYTAPRGLVAKDPSRLLVQLDLLRGLPGGTLRDGPDLAAAREERRLLASVSIAGDRQGLSAALDRLRAVLGRCKADPLYMSVVEGVSQAAFREAVAQSERGHVAEARRILEQIPKESRLYGPAYTVISDLKGK